MKEPTIYDVASHAGVSLATVSRVINNSPKVKETTRIKVLEVIKKLDFKPNLIARNLASKKSTTIACIVNEVSRASVASMLGGVVDVAKQYNYMIKIFQVGDDDLLEQIDLLISEQVSGILILNEEIEEKEALELTSKIVQANIPCVLTNLNFKDSPFPSVMIDYEKAAYEITKQMIKNGRKNIYMFSMVRTFYTNTLKEKGYIRAMEEYGFEPKIFRTNGKVSINKEHFKEFFKHNKIDAGISVRDSIAVSFMNVVKEFGYKIPKNICVVGMQNTKYAELSSPTLTAIHTPIYEIGAEAMQILTKLINKEEIEATKHLLDYKIKERESFKFKGE